MEHQQCTDGSSCTSQTFPGISYLSYIAEYFCCCLGTSTSVSELMCRRKQHKNIGIYILSLDLCSNSFWQYFLNPKVAKEPVPTQLELIAKDILVPLLAVFHQLIGKVASFSAYLTHSLLLILTSFIFLAFIIFSNRLVKSNLQEKWKQRQHFSLYANACISL